MSDETIAASRRPELKGWKAIAEYLDVSMATARRYYMFRFDPLPVVKDRLGNPHAFTSALDAWQERSLLPGPVYDELSRLRREHKRREVSRGRAKCP